MSRNLSTALGKYKFTWLFNSDFKLCLFVKSMHMITIKPSTPTPLNLCFWIRPNQLHPVSIYLQWHNEMVMYILFFKSSKFFFCTVIIPHFVLAQIKATLFLDNYPLTGFLDNYGKGYETDLTVVFDQSDQSGALIWMPNLKFKSWTDSIMISDQKYLANVKKR